MIPRLSLSRSSLLPRYSSILRRYASSSVTASALNPEAFNGVWTRYGWVLVKKTHVARGWTQTRLNSIFDSAFGDTTKKPEWSALQQLVDEWMETADLAEKPKSRKRTAAEKRKEEELRLFMKQSRGDEVVIAEDTTAKKPRKRKAPGSTEVTFTNAWNYFMTITYKKFKHMPEKEARRKIGVLWRQMSMDEKDVYREEYSRLLQSGKDILRGEIVDREKKLAITEKLRQSKERGQQRRLQKLQESRELK